MKKIFIFIIAVLFIYMVFFQRKNPASTAKSIDKEIPTLAVQLKPVDVAKRDSLTLIQSTHNNLHSSADVVETKTEIHQEVKGKNQLEFRQIEEGDGTYAPTPKVLAGMSAKIFSMYYPSDIQRSIMPEVEVKDIQSAFSTGVYPTLNMLKALRLEGPFSGYVWTDDGVPRLKLSWNLRIDNDANPVQGIFSFRVDGVEKGCNATTSGPLENISLLAEDNGAILLMSCDKSFYMQLYRSDASSINGGYFEKQPDGKYKTRDFVMLLRGTTF